MPSSWAQNPYQLEANSDIPPTESQFLLRKLSLYTYFCTEATELKPLILTAWEGLQLSFEPLCSHQVLPALEWKKSRGETKAKIVQMCFHEPTENLLVCCNLKAKLQTRGNRIMGWKATIRLIWAFSYHVVLGQPSPNPWRAHLEIAYQKFINKLTFQHHYVSQAPCRPQLCLYGGSDQPSYSKRTFISRFHSGTIISRLEVWVFFSPPRAQNMRKVSPFATWLGGAGFHCHHQ